MEVKAAGAVHGGVLSTPAAVDGPGADVEGPTGTLRLLQDEGEKTLSHGLVVFHGSG